MSKVDLQGAGCARAAGATAQESFPVSCGGSAGYSVTYNESTGSFSGTLTFNIRDGSGKVYRVENFVVTVDTAMNTVELDGRFYHPDRGYGRHDGSVRDCQRPAGIRDHGNHG